MLLESVSPITKYLSRGTLPLVFTTASAIPVSLAPDVQLKPKFIVESSMKQQAFHWGPGVKIDVFGCDLMDSPCCSGLCGGLELIKDGAMVSRCPCFQITAGDQGVIGVFNLRISWRNRTVYLHNFTAKAWTAQFFTREGAFPVGVTAARLNADRRVRLRFRRAMQDILILVNDELGGFNFTGWMRRGMVEDQGVDQPTNRNEERRMVPSGDLIYHGSNIEPSYPALVAQAQNRLNDMKFVVADNLVEDVDGEVQDAIAAR